jgi:hypothetical protein
MGMESPKFVRILALTATLAVMAMHCKKPMATTGDPIAFDKIASGNGSTELWPPVCAEKGNGKVYMVEGYPHWSRSYLCYNKDCFVDLYEKNKPDGTPSDLSNGDKTFRGYVHLTVEPGIIEEPQFSKEQTKVSGVGGNRQRETSGVLVKDSLALHLSDGSIVNNRVRIRAFFRARDLNGTCQLDYLGGERAKAL